MNAKTEDENKYCFAWFKPSAAEGKDRPILLTRAKWPQGAVITVSFLDGDAEIQRRVTEAAKLWTRPGRANLTLDFRKNTNKTDIRISFRYSGSWSLIGTDCRKEKDLAKPTMNFGWLTAASTDVDVREVVLHEFGHALGLIHEHTHPEGGIQWNKDVIYQELSGPPNNWDKETIDFNMFEAYSKKETNYTKLDPTSIMMYPFPKHWTLNGFSTGMNTDLSKMDEKFIKEMYP